jgi:hypothetical protein
MGWGESRVVCNSSPKIRTGGYADFDWVINSNKL